jgi:hypothetical protein
MEEQLQQINAKLDNILGLTLKLVSLVLGNTSYLSDTDQAALAQLLVDSRAVVQQVESVNVTVPPLPQP